MKFTSLRIQLLLMLTFIALISLGAVAVFASHVTQGAFKNYVKNQQSDSGQQLTLQVITTYRQTHDAQKVQALVQRAKKTSPERVIVVDPSLKIIADTSQQLVGQPFTVQTLLNLKNKGSSANTSAASASSPLLNPAHIISTSVGDIFFDPSAYPPPPQESQQIFVSSVNNALLQAAIIVGLLSMVLTFLLSNSILKPVQALIFAASHMAQGDLSQRVHIKSQNEIGQLSQVFNKMADNIEYSEQLRRDQMSDVAHELRTPLTNIRGYLEALLDGIIEPDSSLIKALYEEAILLSRLVTDLQDLTLAEAGQLRLQCVPIALEGIIMNAINGLALQAKNKSILLDTAIPADLPLVVVDPQRIGQILRNLLTNALKHTPAEGKILVSARAISQAVEICVQDSGVGIDSEHLPHLFKRFYRADRSRSRATGGTGLGLAVVAQLVQAHGGQVSVQSHVGRGSIFTFTLPRPSELLPNEMTASMAKLH